MIQFTNVCKSYTNKGMRKDIFKNLNFCFPENKNIAIMGRNGVGKSTLMRLISGAELPDKGRIIRSGKVSWPLGFSGGLNGSMTGIENIKFIARIYGEDTEKMIDYVQEFAELGESLRWPIVTYSSGMKARLSFGISLAINFDCYLIDEITAVGDVNFKKKSELYFKQKLERSQIIMVSHSINTIKTYCNCGVLLTENKFSFYEDLDTLISDYNSTFNHGVI